MKHETVGKPPTTNRDEEVQMRTIEQDKRAKAVIEKIDRLDKQITEVDKLVSAARSVHEAAERRLKADSVSDALEGRKATGEPSAELRQARDKLEESELVAEALHEAREKIEKERRDVALEVASDIQKECEEKIQSKVEQFQKTVAHLLRIEGELKALIGNSYTSKSVFGVSVPYGQPIDMARHCIKQLAGHRDNLALLVQGKKYE